MEINLGGLVHSGVKFQANWIIIGLLLNFSLQLYSNKRGHALQRTSSAAEKIEFSHYLIILAKRAVLKASGVL